jgi:hypothetical protein
LQFIDEPGFLSFTCQQRASAQTETDQQIFQRQIDATDKLIDALVYELYELTQEEIRIIEGGAVNG